MAIIKTPAAADSPYPVTADATPAVLRASASGATVLANVAAAAATAVAATDTATAAAANVSYYATGIEGVQGLANYGRVFAGANVYVTLEQPQYVTYNQNFTGNGTVGGSTGQIQFNNNGAFGGSTNLTFDGANLAVGGNITGNYILGNGSQLTGINASSNKIFNGTSYANIANASGNLVISANGSPWTFGTDGSTIFPTLTTQRGDNPSGTISGQTLLFGDANQEAIISTPDGTPGNEYSQRLVINPGAGNDFGEGGDIYLWAGRGGANSGSGGDVKIRGGYAPADGTGGYIRMDGGESQGNGAPGFIEITGGQGGTTSGGYVQITGGVAGSGTGGAVDLIGGFGQAGPGANVSITGGGSANGLAEYGNVNIGSGASTWSFRNNGTTGFPNNTINPGNNQDLTIRTQSSGNAFTEMYQSSNSWEAFAEDDNTEANSAYAWIRADLATANTPRVFINNVRGSDGLDSTWTFDDAGKITLPHGASLNDTAGDSVAFGQNAGANSQYQHAVAIGLNAGYQYQGEDSVAIGFDAGYYNQGRGVAIGYRAGQGTSQSTPVSATYGGSGPAHIYVSGTGNPSLVLDSVTNVITYNQYVTGNNIPANTYVTNIYPGEDRIEISQPPTAPLVAGDAITFIGSNIGVASTSSLVAGARVLGTSIPVGTYINSILGPNNIDISQRPSAPLVDGDYLEFYIGQGEYATAIGYDAGIQYQDVNAVAVGRSAGTNHQGANTVAVGYVAGAYSQGANAVAIGAFAGTQTQGINTVAIGYHTGGNTQGARAVAIGEDAGHEIQGANSIAIGAEAGRYTQGTNTLAIGHFAGLQTQGNSAVAMGWTAGYQYQGTAAVSVGEDAGYTTQGNAAIAMGLQAGYDTQGANAIAIGYTAGLSAQGNVAIAIGQNAGQSQQGTAAVAMGWNAGQGGQGNAAIAIGEDAGFTNQGEYSVAIGYQAGYYGQANNSIVLNASGDQINGITANSFTVKPVRNASTGNVLYYDQSSGEITFDVGGGGSANIIYNGTSNVSIPVANSNVTINANTYQWNFGVDGNTTFPNGAIFTGYDLYAAANSYIELAGDTGNTYMGVSNTSAFIQTDWSGAQYQWTFDANGNLTTPGGSGDITLTGGNITGANNVSTGTVTLVNGAVIRDTANNAVAFGNAAGLTSQGGGAVAIGFTAGYNTQGLVAVAIGDQAGQTSQGTAALAIGINAGQNSQGNIAIAIGGDAGQTSQGAYSVAIGYYAGHTSQGSTALAIGNFAGRTSQGNNSIILNATGANLDQTVANTFTVAPVRNDNSNIAEVMFYNTTSKEITYGNVISVSGNVTAANFFGNGNTLSNVATQVTGSWDVPVGNSTQNFTVNSGTYSMWVDCNITNGILVWNATATVTNTNVPVVGAQYAWVYNGGGTPIDFTSIPNQFTGTANAIVRSNTAPSSTTNRFDFGINNTSGGNVTVRYGYTTIS